MENNFRRFEGGFSVKGTFSSDPAQGTSGDVYYNTTLNTFKYYNGTHWAPMGGGSGGVIKVTLIDQVTSSLPSSTPYTIDSVALADQDTVLFTNLTSGANEIYQASISGSTITWTLTTPFAGGLNAAPAASDQVIIAQGTAFAQQVGTFNGTNWAFNQYVRYFNGLDYWEQSATQTSNLIDNNQNDVFTMNVSGSENLKVDYSVSRGGTKSVGTLHITSDDTNVSLADTGTDLGDTGVSFSALVISGVLHVQYTTTSTGFAGVMKYDIKRWSDAPGGPAGVPSYTGGTSGIGAAGTNTQVQYNDSGDLGADANFTWDKTTQMLQVGGQVVSSVNSLTLLDNQPTDQPLFSYNAAAYPNMIVNYSIARGGDVEVGRMLLPNNGTTVVITTESSFTGVVGINFSAIISGGNVQVQYTSSSTGSGGTFQYYINAWA
jgi:hypothetical protein